MLRTQTWQTTYAKSRGSLLLKTVLGALFLALCSQIRIPLPFTPIPLTCQTLAILFLGVTLGSKQATASTILYLFAGLIGLPVFAGWNSNPFAFFEVSMGYLFAMPLMAYIAGFASFKKSLSTNLIILCSASLLMLAMGTWGLSLFVGWNSAFLMGFYPFLFGDALKVFIVTLFLTKQK